mmetsp:Transcript_35290/g.92285  ORF Transcript_35290/g.92285 Transcript_35290/m.92285 type:complete len:716 (-) Transcript_35290:29-2176(-)
MASAGADVAAPPGAAAPATGMASTVATPAGLKIPPDGVAGSAPPSPNRSSSADDPSLTKSLFKYGWNQLLKGVDPAEERKTFWDEFFLIKVDTKHLRMQIRKVDAARMVEIRKTLHVIFDHCVDSLTSPIQIRAANAMLTLGIWIQEAHLKTGFKNPTYDVIDAIVGFEEAPRRIGGLISGVAKILRSRTAGDQLKDVALRLLIIIATANPEIDGNAMLSHFMTTSMFDELVMLLRKEDRVQHGRHTLLLLGLLLSFRRDDPGTHNPYTEALRKMQDPVSLNAIGAVVSAFLVDRNLEWSSRAVSDGGGSASQGMLSGVGSFFSRLFDVPEEGSGLKINPPESAALMLPLYQIVRLNPAFVNVVTHTRVLGKSHADSRTHEADAAKSADAAAAAALTQSESTNLLSSFLTFSSFLVHDTKPAATASFCYLCWTTLLCICDDKHVDTFLHDDKVTVPISLFYAEKRHRPAEIKRREGGPLAVAVFDLCAEFMLSHLKKNLQADLYSLCLGVVHRLLCWQKKQVIRLTFEWKTLWTALITILSFVVRHEATLVETIDVFALCSQVITNLNLFITFGDTFLPTPGSYDELYYELIRAHSTFEGLYAMARRHADGPRGTGAEKLAGDLSNIRAITNYFNPKIAKAMSQKGRAPLTSAEILKLVREGYAYLTLKLFVNLCNVDPFTETAEHTSKLSDVVRAIVEANQKTVMLVPTIAPGH